MANAASSPASPDRPQPLPGGARAILSPVRWGWLAVVAGAHAAGLGLLASGAGEPRSSAAPASAQTISVRMIGTEREAAAKEAAAVKTEASMPAAVRPAIPRPQAREHEVEPPNEAVAAGAEETAPAVAPVTTVPAPPARREIEAAASARAATRPVRSRPASQPVSATAAKPTPPPAHRPIAAAVATAEAGEATHSPATEPVQPPPHTAPAATMVHDSTPAKAQAAAPVSVPAGSRTPALAATAVVAARYDAAYLNNPKPSYPAISRRMGEQGEVLLRVRVMRDGLPRDVEILAPSGSPRLDRAAAEAVRGWRFTPARQGDEAVESWLRVPIVFRLDD